MTTADVYGPIDVVVFEMDPDNATGGIAAAVLDLLESGIVQLYDLILVAKDEDGTVTEIEIDALDGEVSIAQFSGARSGLVGVDDLDDIGAVVEPGRMAFVLVYENTWAIPFVAAVREAGAELVATSRINAQDIMDTLDALEAED